MVLPIETAVRSLAETAERTTKDERLHSRLGELRDLLRGDLDWIEVALERAASSGASPGRDAARHLVSHGGKRVRPMALLLSTACFGSITPAAQELALVVELVHSATLLHDDVIDEGTERRGSPTARRMWGNAVSVLAGDLLLVEALERTERRAPEMLSSLIATLRQLVDGEITQLKGRRDLDVSLPTYERILSGKTASLFRWATRTGARIAGAAEHDQESLAEFGELIGMAFQLVDDLLDYTSDRADKTPLADLREGKLTLPLVLAVERDPSLIGPVRRVHAGDDSLVDEVRAVVLGSGACEKVRRRAQAYTERAVEILGRIEESEARSLLEQVALQLSERDQ